MKLFMPPKTAYTSTNDIGKFNMIWTVCFILLPVFLTLLLFHIVNDDNSWKTSAIAAFVSLLDVLILWKTRKFKVVAALSVLAGTIIVQASVFVIPEAHVITDVMWILLVGVFAFFLLGSIFGYIVLFINLTGLTLYTVYGSDMDVISKGLSIEEAEYTTIFNNYFVAFAFAFVLARMIHNINEGNARYEKEIARNEILLKEIHHRVKNNLQIISSLLKLQAADIADEKVVEHYGEAINRIRSMALIHEKMYTNDDLSKIDIQSYVIALVQDIIESIQSNCNLELNVNSDVEKIDVKSIVPISLIFNELITNSIKHGFKDMNNGKIDVNITRINKIVHFRYCDNGQWHEPEGEVTFGLELIYSLTDQLGGKWERTTDNGTQYHFTFNVEEFFFADNGETTK